MLGVYDYTVILTYISLWISIGGMMLSLNGHLDLAVLCLALSGLCDMFDGKIARTKKDRTEIEKRFGIQIDSLCDIVCFGVGPAIICYCMGMNGIVGVLILMFYVLAGLIRLAWFNVTEECRQDETTENRKCYQESVLSCCFLHPVSVSVCINHNLSSYMNLRLNVQTTATATTPTNAESVLFPGFFNLKSVINKSPTRRTIACSAILKSQCRNGRSTTRIGNAIDMDVIGNP